MTEDKFEEFLTKTAQSYNAPPVRVPREEMWSAIQAKRAAGPRVVYGGGANFVLRHRLGTKVWLGAAAAAMLLVATGVGIGRWTAAPKVSAVASALPAKPLVVEPTVQSGSEPTLTGGAAVSSPDAATPGAPDRGISSGGRAIPGAPRETSPLNVAAANPPRGASSSAYQIMTAHHLSETEALLTSFRTRSNADQQMDAQLGAWARQLLSNTRLLLDSPVANDPQRRPLLQDLELVLVQIVQLSPASTTQDRDLIEKSLKQDHVMTRLRTAIPAGSQRGS